MQAAIRVKMQEHQRQAIEARIRKLQVDEERAQKKISEAEREAAFVVKMQEEKERGYRMTEEARLQMRGLEEENRVKFGHERQKQAAQVYRAKERQYLENRDGSTQMKAEQQRIRSVIYHSKLRAVQGKQAQYLAVRAAKDRARSTREEAARAARGTAHQQKIDD